jgi:uncharacterized protein YqiB (DUF1249 family)
MQQAPHDRQGLSLLSLMVSAYEDAMVARQCAAEKTRLCNGGVNQISAASRDNP